jgi:hypothetical protein
MIVGLAAGLVAALVQLTAGVVWNGVAGGASFSVSLDQAGWVSSSDGDSKPTPYWVDFPPLGAQHETSDEAATDNGGGSISDGGDGGGSNTEGNRHGRSTTIRPDPISSSPPLFDPNRPSNPPWLRGLPPSVHCGGRWHTVSDGTLKWSNARMVNGTNYGHPDTTAATPSGVRCAGKSFFCKQHCFCFLDGGPFACGL